MHRNLLLVVVFVCICAAGAAAQTLLTGEFNGEPDKDGWSLNGGTGERTYIEEVTFEKAFTVPPRVLVSLSGYEATAGPDGTSRVHATAFRVTKTGFTLRVKTWGDGRVGLVWGNWIAVGVK